MVESYVQKCFLLNDRTKAFLDTWKFFVIAALPGFLSNFWVILRSPIFLNTEDFIEWAVTDIITRIVVLFKPVRYQTRLYARGY